MTLFKLNLILTLQALKRDYCMRLFETRASAEDTRRREYVFSVLLKGAIALTGLAFGGVLIGLVVEGSEYPGASPLIIAVPVLVFTGLYRLRRRGFKNWQAYAFLTVFLLLGTYALYLYGFFLPEGLLTYAVVIMMAGVLISTRAALLMMGLTVISLVCISYVQVNGITQPDLRQLRDPLRPLNVAVYACLFAVISLSSWLSSREIERSLYRARRSEAELRRQRNRLEIKVRERTRELEQIQAEKLIEMHRFAEFGRLSSTLLHELANPLTSVSIELEQLAYEKDANTVRHAREGVAHMERYIEAARRQLRNQGDVKTFDSRQHLEAVIEFLEPVARSQQVALVTELTRGLPLHGDSVRLDQIVANLVANAIDACSLIKPSSKRVVTVKSRRQHRKLEIIVHDQGTGITETDHDKIFEPFYTTKSTQRGTGIGLSITKRAVEEGFQGTISVASSPSKGTTFTVLLPLYEV